MAGTQQTANDLLDTVERLDSDKNGVTLEELRKTSKYFSEKLMQNLRSAADELRADKNPNPEKIAALRKSLERLAALNGLKASQEQEIKALYNGELKDFYALFAELKTRLDGLKADVATDKAPKSETVVVDAKASKPAVAAETVVVEGKSAKAAAPSETVVIANAKPAKPASKAETKDVASEFAAKRDFLLADESLFQNAKGERTTGFGRVQLKELFADSSIIANEVEFDRLVIRLAGSPLNLKNEEEAKAVRAKFIENLSLRLVTLSSLYERTVGEKLGDKKSSGGLLHILKGRESELVKRMFDVAGALEKKNDGKGSGITLEEIANTLKGIGLGAILGPVYLEWRSRQGIAKEEIKTGGKSDKLAIATSDSKQNLELRVAPAFTLFGFALGISVEANANFNDREREIVGKVKEAAKAYDSIIDPETGYMNEKDVPKEYLEDARAFNRTLMTMETGDAARDKVLSKSIRDAFLYEFTDRLVRADAGTEFKGIGAGVALLFVVVPVKAFIKANIQNLSAEVVSGKTGTLAALDALRLGKGNLEKFGIAMTQVPGGFEYRIDPSKGYQIDNRSGLKIENGLIKSEKPLYFKHLKVVSDSMKEGDKSVQTLVVSAEPLEIPGTEAAESKGRESIYAAQSNDQLRNEVTNAMAGISSRNIREKITGIPALQEAIAKAYASGNPEAAFKLLSHVKVEGKRPLAALAAFHSLDTPADKRDLLNMVLQETAGDWRIRNFDAIKTDPKAFKDFVTRTGYRGTQKDLRLSHVDSAWNLGGTFDKNLVAKTGLGKMSKKDQQEALAALGKARAEFSAPVGKLDAINERSRTITNAIGFVNFHQVAIDATGKSHKRFQEIVPVAGTVKTVDVEPTKFESAAIRKQLVAEIPTFVLESLRATINEQAKQAGAAEIGSVDDVRKLLLNNGSKAEGAFRPDIQLTSDLAYTRFAKCLNDTYLIQNINLCVTGPNGKTTCAPTIPEVTSDLVATVGEKTNDVTDVGIGAAFKTIPEKGGNNGGNNGGPGGTTTPGVGGNGAGPGNVTVPLGGASI